MSGWIQSFLDPGQNIESGGGAGLDYDRAGVTRDVSGGSEATGSGPAA